MATIKAIEGRSVHQIQSGQVIVDLNSVVKELVENSLDAGATSIEVRFKNQGLDSIEVSDNGKGISPDDFERIALKHYTSKLSSYEDLNSLETFGFRGEALSSLCALSKFHIITARAEDGALGKRLDFENCGKLKGTSVVAAQRGTTVVIENLFQGLPVRRKELEKNIKREYGKVTTLLNSYACISVGVRYAVSNQMPKGKKVVVFSTKSNTTTKENIVNVFGAKTLLSLLRLDLKLLMQPSNGPSTQSARNWSTQATDRSREVLIEGHISKPVSGEGRQAPDRQMYFVNSRPCGLPQVSKAFNEVYKSFNISQSPFVFANLIMDTNAYDVNVSPDKRSIMLHDQTALLDSLKSALTELFEHIDHTVPQSTLPNRQLPLFQPLTLSKKPSTGPFLEEGDEGNDLEEDEGHIEQELPSESRIPSSRRFPSARANLIESWAARDSEVRKEPSNTGLSKDEQSSVNSARTASHDGTVVDGSDLHEAGCDRNGIACTNSEAVLSGNDENVSANAAGHPQQAPNPLRTPYDDLFSKRPPVPQRVQDFNAFMDQVREAEQSQPVANDSDQHLNHNLASNPEACGGANEEPSIPATGPSSQKATPGPVANAFDRMRPKRTSLQTAEITVGDQTTTTIIGSAPMYKKRRVHEPANSQAVAALGCSPLLARGLRSFAAPGSQFDSDDGNLHAELPKPHARVSEDTEEEEEDRSEADGDESQGNQPDESEDSENDDENDTARSSIQNENRNLETRRHDDTTSDGLDADLLASQAGDGSDDDYMDEDEKKVKEDEKVARLIQEAEEAAAKPSSQILQRASQVLKNSSGRKDSTLQLCCTMHQSLEQIDQQATALTAALNVSTARDGVQGNAVVKDEMDSTQAENKLSLTVAKTDFERMRIIGQFNLGFILAVRPASRDRDQDELFIIDQHAADEKYNYERFRRTVTLQSQRLVQPKALDLTAVEQEVVLNHREALKANGFDVEITSTEDEDVRGETRSCRLLTLPLSHSTTFDLSDLSELLYLLSETSVSTNSTIPRPKKVQRMLAMRACRSSIMVGKTLTMKQMEQVVRHMGEMEKPWNCPHGRPTMRHLAGLGEWNGWREGLAVDEDEDGIGGVTDWKGWLKGR